MNKICLLYWIEILHADWLFCFKNKGLRYTKYVQHAFAIRFQITNLGGNDFDKTGDPNS